MWSMGLITLELAQGARFLQLSHYLTIPLEESKAFILFRKRHKQNKDQINSVLPWPLKNNGKNKLQSLQMSPKLVNQIGKQETNVSRTFWTAS